MVSINIPVEDALVERLEKFGWVNWSDVGREEANKRRIFEEFRKKRDLSEEDQKFCDSIDWHPVDELPLKPEFIEKLKRIKKGKHVPMDLKKLEKLMGLK